ncbi:penicillin-binding transpeptidase domain-containing protein [Bacteroides pyogenes]|uniref:Penicillin-binding protein 2 n=1 Tax=Bacteroides pyogenes TaxID=310300 RepID=A0A5D3ECB9_9BACE|nr:penicillin-binding transpeptidase domain-containing protein [Bacteroides pyogenes]MBR8705692.1 Peptidoglycan D,D-transpeptidase MrdA [Bacteroides pyogenes]TYK32715.1 penicillin-binding protein 2 [Bacteroides pyogenes]TYK45657.1 penicillin-binding protein 2 [Bacteroides pyogenes]
MAKDYTLEKRKFVVGGIALSIVIIYLIRLFVLQIMTDDYKKHADSNAFLNKIQYPSRGAIYDRNGKLLVFNQPAYDITVIPKEIENLDTLDLCESLGITRAQFLKIMNDMRDRYRNPGYSKYTNQPFMSQLSAEECGVFQEKLFKFRGFYVQRRTIRQYSYNAAAHALGDIGEVSVKDMEADEDGYYIRGDYIGKLGVERTYEKYLRGEKGVEVLLRDAHGRIQGHYMDGEYDKPSIPGKNLTLSLDIDLQMLGERLLKNKIGSIVAIEPESGEILCLVSSPNYDPHLMIGRQRGKNHLVLQRDKKKPLLNRALMGVYPPGSTFKTAQGLTFLQEGIVSTQSPLFPCSHGFHYGRLTVGCHAHGSPLPLIPSIATSCNSYFCWGLFRMFGDRKYGSPQNAITVWKDHMVSQGFGYKLGVDLPGEKRGLIPNAQFYDKAYKGHWNGLTVISIAIGQGEILTTPLQIANLGATIANRGYFITPHIVKEIQGEQLDSLYRFPRYTTIDKKHYEDVAIGMRAAVTGGTCRVAGTILPNVEICGKTGTAQNRGHDHSVFMGFAPMDKPKIAVAVYVENGGFGAVYGVPIGTLIMEQYLNGTLSPSSEAKAEEYSNRIISYGDEER